MSILDKIYDELEGAQYYGRYIATRCLWHDDSNPSLLIYEDSYRCLACRRFGKTSKLLQELSGGIVTPPIQVKGSWRNPFTRWMQSEDLEDILLDAHTLMMKYSGQSSYLRNRGITKNTISRLKLGYRDGWYTFPIIDEAEVIGATARVSPENDYGMRYVNPPGQDGNLLYIPSIHRIFDSDTVLLTFGIIDAVILYQMGFASMSTTTGKRVDPDVLSDWRKYIYIIPDKYEEAEASTLALSLGWRGRLCLLPYDETEKDVNDVFMSNKSKLVKCLGDI